ncbi:MAG TPA: hypothetical protein VHB79_25645 [Polyangiaceae bacterium]|nr:hypothetical protein [Polyangiaceae bacterium]
MSNLKLVADEPTPLEKMLLDASRAEQPSEDHKARLRAALGIGVPLSGPLAAPTPTHNAPPPAAAAGGVAKSAWLGKVALGVAALALAGVLLFTRGGSAPTAPVSPVKAPVAEMPRPLAEPAPVAAVPEAPPAVSPLPPVEATPQPHPARSDASAAAGDLTEQIRLIEAARAGVAAHDAKAALAALDSYAQKFPRGSFGQEATVLRIRALDQAGDSARATTLAKSFIARFPNSPHVARLSPIAERGASR